MGRHIYITKIKEENNIHYYEVADDRPDDLIDFFIAIDASKQTIYYYLTFDCKTPIAFLDFNVMGPILPLLPFDQSVIKGVFLPVAYQAYKAINDNHFPKYISRFT